MLSHRVVTRWRCNEGVEPRRVHWQHSRMDPLFLRALRKEPVARPPVWLMRQAGRYLPEYQAVRATAGGFLGLCKNPEKAAEVTLQPIRRFGFDASIVFSDILVVPEAMGMELTFGAGEGPRLQPPIRSRADLDRLREVEPKAQLSFVLETVKRVVDGLPGASGGVDVPLIGFAGAPFTVASYMVEGEGSKNFIEVKRLMYSQPDVFRALLDKLVAATATYLVAQVEAGCRALQLFDTWAGELSADDLATFAVDPARRIIQAVRQQTKVPVIYFARGCADALDVVKGAEADAYGLDWRARIDKAWPALGDVAVQGNLDPAALFAPVDVVRRLTQKVLDAAAGRPGHIFNLGHGILPETPIASVDALMDVVRGSERR